MQLGTVTARTSRVAAVSAPVRALTVLSAGLGRPSSTRRLADRLADATRARLAEQGVDVVVTHVDVRDHAHAVTDQLLTGFAGADLAAAQRAVTGADALIAVTPVFNGSYSGLFKSFLDVLERDALAGVPVLLGATGGSGRHSLAIDYAMRPLFASLRATVAPTAVFAATADWASPAGNGLAGRIARAGDELAGLVVAGARRTAADPPASVTPFDRRLTGEG